MAEVKAEPQTAVVRPSPLRALEHLELELATSEPSSSTSHDLDDDLQRILDDAEDDGSIDELLYEQSFTSPEDRGFHRVHVRERSSLRIHPRGILAPDLALGLAWTQPAPPDRDLGIFLRRDQERGGRKPLFVRDPVRMARTPAAYLALAARHRRIVTDRLHFAVAGLHAGRDVTLVANDYHKNRSMHETWLAAFGCRFAATAAEALASARRAA